MNKTNNFRRSELISLVKEGNVHPDKLKKLNQTDRKTLKFILDTFAENPEIQCLTINKKKFETLKSDLLNHTPKIIKDSRMTLFFQKLIGDYVRSDILASKLHKTISCINNSYSVTPGDYLTNLHKLQDNLNGVSNFELLEKAEQTLRNEILPKLNSKSGFLIKRENRDKLEIAKSGFEHFIKSLRPESLDLLVNMPVHPPLVPNSIGMLLMRMSNYEPHNAEIYHKFGSLSPRALMLIYKPIIPSDALLKGALQVLQMSVPNASPKVQTHLLNQKLQVLDFVNQWLDIYGTELQDPKIQSAFNTLVIQGMKSPTPEIKREAEKLEKKLQDNISQYLAPDETGDTISKIREHLNTNDYENVLIAAFEFINSNIELVDANRNQQEIKIDFMKFVNEVLLNTPNINALKNPTFNKALKTYLENEKDTIDRYLKDIQFTGVGLKLLNKIPSSENPLLMLEFVKNINNFLIEAQKSELEFEKNGVEVPQITSGSIQIASAQQKQDLLNLMKEMYDTEISFKKQFQSLTRKEWPIPGSSELVTFFQSLGKQGLINEEELEILENGWQALSNSSSVIANQLYTLAARTETTEQKLATLLEVINSDGFSIHLKNMVELMSKSNQINEIIKNLSQNPKGKELLYKFRHEKNSGAPIDSALITPVQRLPRYELILKQILKDSHIFDTQEQQEIRSTLECLQAKIHIANSMQHISKYLH